MRLYYTNTTGTGKAQTRPDLSLGGFISTTLVPNNRYSNLFGDISSYSVSENVDEFIGLALLNETGLKLEDVLFYFDYPANCQKKLEFAFVTFNFSNEMEVIPNSYSQPYNAEFQEADGEVNAVNIGSIDVDGKIGIWIKKIIQKQAILDEYSDDNMILNGTPAVYDEDISFVVSWNHLPTLTTVALSGITQTETSSGGNVLTDGDLSVTARGVCWNTLGQPVITESHILDGIGTGSFVSSITGLTGNTTYYVRAYATNTLGTAYGNQLILLTSPVLSTVMTNVASLITATTVRSGGNVTDDGGSSVTEKGVCYSTSTNPTILDSILPSVSVGEGSFISNITGLTTDTTYYLRAYSTNVVGTSYGDEITFTTL